MQALLHWKARARITSWQAKSMALLAAWLFVGFQDAFCQQQLAVGWRYVFSYLGCSEVFQHIASNGEAEFTKVGSRILLLSYGTLYCAIALLLVQVYARSWKTTKLACLLYAGLILSAVLLNEAGKLLMVSALRVVAYRFMTMIMSPMPLLLLLATLYYVTRAKNTDAAS